MSCSKCFIFFSRYFKLVKDFQMTDEERLEYYDMVVHYGLYGRRPARRISNKVRHVFELVKENILTSNREHKVVMKDEWDAR